MRYSFTQIQTIVEIHRSGLHVSKAARRLNTSQSVLSKHLKSFENAFGSPVFIRSGKRLTALTVEGAKLMQHAEGVLSNYDSIELIRREVTATTQESLSVATTPTIAQYLLANTVSAFSQAHRDVRLHIKVEESEKAIEAVHHGRCDLAIVPIGKLQITGLELTPLLEWTRLLIGQSDCKLFSSKRLTLEMIASEPLIAFETPVGSLKDTFDEQGLQPTIALTTSNPEVMKAYAALGLGVAVVATPTFDPKRDANLVARDVSDLFPSARIGLLQRKEIYQSAIKTKFMSYLMENLPDSSDAGSTFGSNLMNTSE